MDEPRQLNQPEGLGDSPAALPPDFERPRAKKGWRRLRWPLMLAGISGGVGALLSFGLSGSGFG